jgi:methyl-accepting chemotaxis protein
MPFRRSPFPARAGGASTEIARNVERIAQMAEQNNAAASGNAHTADGLRQLAETLSGEVAKFRT